MSLAQTDCGAGRSEIINPGPGSLGQPEVKNFGLTSGRNKDIGGLNVAMNDASRVRRVECIGNLNG